MLPWFLFVNKRVGDVWQSGNNKTATGRSPQRKPHLHTHRLTHMHTKWFLMLFGISTYRSIRSLYSVISWWTWGTVINKPWQSFFRFHMHKKFIFLGSSLLDFGMKREITVFSPAVYIRWVHRSLLSFIQHPNEPKRTLRFKFFGSTSSNKWAPLCLTWLKEKPRHRRSGKKEQIGSLSFCHLWYTWATSTGWKTELRKKPWIHKLRLMKWCERMNQSRGSSCCARSTLSSLAHFMPTVNTLLRV